MKNPARALFREGIPDRWRHEAFLKQVTGESQQVRSDERWWRWLNSKRWSDTCKIRWHWNRKTGMSQTRSGKRLQNIKIKIPPRLRTRYPCVRFMGCEQGPSTWVSFHEPCSRAPVDTIREYLHCRLPISHRIVYKRLLIWK